MRDLKCGMRDCKHNEGYSCHAHKIMVTQSTDCDTYEKSAKSSNMLFEAGVDFAGSDYSVDTSVACTAPCVFAKNNRCIANGITVMAEKPGEAICTTFIKSTKVR